MNTGSTSFIRSALSLSLVAAAGTTLLTGVNHLTADRIEQQERRVILEQLGQIIPPDRYDNVLQDDCFSFSDEASFPQGQRVIACRARLQGQPVAVVLRFAAIDGYSGPIGLLMGIEADGRLSGVRVTSHRETPGLGDAIEIEKSDWIRSFDDKSLGAPPRSLWTVRRDGGSFDQFTGATITPRAVVKAVRLALEYHERNRELLYSAAANMKQSEP